MTLSTELFTRQNFTRGAIALIGLAVLATQLPAQLERQTRMAGDRQGLEDVARQNERMEQERELANERYEKGCRILLGEDPSLYAIFSPQTRAVSLSTGLPLSEGRCVAGADGTTAIVGKDGYLEFFAGNADPEIVRKAIERQNSNAQFALEGVIND